MPRPPKNPDTEKPVIEELSELQKAINKRARNPETGLLNNLEYKFTEDGKIDWLSMLPPETLYINKDKFGADVDISSLDINELPNDKKIMKLDAILWILEKGGATSVKFNIGSSYPDYASCTCELTWPKSFLYPDGVVTGGAGEAHSFNNVAPFKYLLATLSENKSLSRAVRKFAHINTVYSSDELRGEPVEKESENNHLDSMPQSALETAANSSKKISDGCKKHNKSVFEFVKYGYLLSANDEQKEKALNWKSFKDIPKDICFSLLSRIKEADKKNE